MTISYPNLPGIEVTLRDGGLILPEDATTESLLIIAPTNSVPTVDKNLENPVLIRTKEDLVAENLATLNNEFVDADGSVNKLAAAWKAAYEGGARQIYVLGVPVSSATDKYKAFFVGVHKNLLGILEDFPVDNLVIVDGFADLLTTELVVDTILDADDGDFPFGTDLALLAGVDVVATKYFGNFAKTLALYCETQTVNHNSVVGFIGTSAPTGNGLAEVKTKADALVTGKKQYSGFVQIVAGPELGYQLPGSTDLYIANGVVSYAALVTNLRPESATTNKPVYGVSSMHYNMSLRQLDALTGAQYVSFRLKNGQVHVTDGITSAQDQQIGNVTYKSDFIRLSTLRITQAAVSLIREVADPYVGEPNGMPQRNALNAAIRGGLEGMKNAGAIADYRFTITATPRQRILGQSVISLELVPAFEMRKITVDVSLRALLGTGVEA